MLRPQVPVWPFVLTCLAILALVALVLLWPPMVPEMPTP
jgi:hypothetical protein